jgi:hypothetical protein
MNETDDKHPENEHDERTRRCPRLGHDVTFHYCRTQEGSRICKRLAHCWWEQFDIRAWLRRNMPERAEDLTEPARPDKMGSLMEIIEKAKKRKDEGEGR